MKVDDEKWRMTNETGDRHASLRDITKQVEKSIDNTPCSPTSRAGGRWRRC